MRRFLVPFVVLVALVASGPAAVALPTPPPTPVPVPCTSSPSGVCSSPSPFPTALDTPPPSTTPPDVKAVSAIVEDLATGQVLFSKDPDEERALASTTKVMTALLVLERAKPTEMVRIGPDAAEEGSAGAGFSELGLQLGERLSVEDLLFALMLQSSNDAAIALADHVSGTVDRFLADMNARARELGLRHTVFFSPNGLDDRGHSTAREMAAITREAMAKPEFAEVVGRRFDTIPAPSGPARRVQNRNVLLWLYRGATGVKTGYTSAAGFCLVATAERDGRGVVAVVLGAPTTQDSFDDAAALLGYGFTGYALHTLVQKSEAFRPLPVGTQHIPVQAAIGLQRLLPEPVGKVTKRVAILPRLALPIDPGRRVGSVSFRAGGLQVGSVPLVAAGRPEGDGEETGDGQPAWWLRGIDSVARFGLDTLFGLFRLIPTVDCGPMSDVAKILFSASDIRRRVRQLGTKIAADYAGRSPVLVTVLKGGTMFLADLIRAIPLPLRVDFMSISAYGKDSESSGGVVKILKDLDQPIGGEEVIVVEDIVDTGLTLSYLLSALRERGPASIEVCTLLDKTARRIPVVPIRYQGFECPDRFVVGYGLDFAERYRNLPDILEVLDLAALQADPGVLSSFLHGEPPVPDAG